MRFLIAGSSGLIGTALARRLAGEGHEVRTLVRREPANERESRWDPRAGVVPAEPVAWADALVNLAGAPLTRLPWTAAYRGELLESRVRATATLAAAVRDSASPPRVWVNGSAVGYYGDRPGERLDEASAPGSGFLAGLVREWEAATAPAVPTTRVVLARTGLVLARGGALRPLTLATRLGLGSRIGPGRQHWPWVGLADEVGALVHLAARSDLSGPVNLVGPIPATSVDITRELASRLRRPHLFRLPAALLRAVLGAAADDLLLADQLVAPSRLLDDDYAFVDASPGTAIARIPRP